MVDLTHSFDLDAYRERIGYVGPLEPTLEVLRTLAERHVTRIPFENLDALLSRPIDLSPAALENKLVKERRGGYCFEQNGLMLGILAQIGFDVRPLSGRVRLESPRDVTPPRTHLFLVVTLEGNEWIFDVGVGGFSLTTPIRLNTREEQTTLHETRRIIEEGGMFFHQAWMGDFWQDVYEFTGEAMPEIDREVGNWWTSTHPKSKFRQNLFCARAAENGERINLMNDRLIRRRGPEILSQKTLVSAEELLETLREAFGLEFPLGTRFGTGDKPWPTA